MDIYNILCLVCAAFLPTHFSGLITGYLNPLKGERTVNERIKNQ